MQRIFTSILLILSSIIVSCQSESKKIGNKDYAFENNSISLIISELRGAKIDENGTIRCTKYSESKFYVDSIKMYGTDLRSVISLIYNNNSKFINIKMPNLENIVFDIKYKNIISAIPIDTMQIINKLKEIYKFDIIKELVSTKVWEVEIFDSTKLVSNLKFSNINSNLSVSEDKISIENVKFQAVISFLNDYYNEIIIGGNQIQNFCTMKLKFTNFEEMRKQLEKYGVRLNPVQKEILYFNVISKNP